MALRILANENVPGEAINALRRLGHDVVWTRIHALGSPDEAVLAQAQAEDRIVVTFDKDFGELAFRRGLPSSSGIILFRVTTQSPAYTQGTLEPIIPNVAVFQIIYRHLGFLTLSSF
jgi:predicted nuclease of predicted toxin-antitoxin system